MTQILLWNERPENGTFGSLLCTDTFWLEFNGTIGKVQWRQENTEGKDTAAHYNIGYDTALWSHCLPLTQRLLCDCCWNIWNWRFTAKSFCTCTVRLSSNSIARHNPRRVSITDSTIINDYQGWSTTNTVHLSERIETYNIPLFAQSWCVTEVRWRHKLDSSFLCDIPDFIQTRRSIEEFVSANNAETQVITSSCLWKPFPGILIRPGGAIFTWKISGVMYSRGERTSGWAATPYALDK